jgi:hypothetical protein
MEKLGGRLYEIIEAAKEWVGDESDKINAFGAGTTWAEENPHWYDAELMLPTDYAPIFVVKTKRGNFRAANFDPMAGYFHDGWNQISDVTYWMPIYKLPEGGEQ